MTARKLVGRVGAAALGLALLGSSATAPTAAAAPPITPSGAGPVQGTCNPYGAKWCVNERYRARFDKAVDWSDKHTDRKDRDPVPYPGPLSYAINGHRIVYVVLFRYATDPHVTRVWKYGITAQNPWQKRANVGVRSCRGSDERLDCQPDWVGVSSDYRGFGRARFMEASLVKRYQLQHGDCPPGQKSSCS